MLLTEFIKAHSDWEELLSAPPYCIKIKREGGYIIFSYNQLESDFSNGLVRECRGVILDEATFRPVCVPFYKFANYGESYAAEIDWTTARTQEKIDGSLIKVWYDRGEWHVSTSGSIFAENAILSRTDLFEEDCPYNSFADLFNAAKNAAGLNFDSLDKNCTYMFELVSPYNKVIIMYGEVQIYHIGTRDMRTLKEINVDIGVRKPKEFALSSLTDCVEAASALPDDKEGYVVVDGDYNRIKVKNPAYVALHHLKNNEGPSMGGMIAIVRANEVEEFLTYFPECRSRLEECINSINEIIAEMERTVDELSAKSFETQKDFADAVKNKPFSGFYFNWYKNRGLTPKEWFWRMPDVKIKRYLK